MRRRLDPPCRPHRPFNTSSKKRSSMLVFPSVLPAFLRALSLCPACVQFHRLSSEIPIFCHPRSSTFMEVSHHTLLFGPAVFCRLCHLSRSFCLPPVFQLTPSCSGSPVKGLLYIRVVRPQPMVKIPMDDGKTGML